MSRPGPPSVPGGRSPRSGRPRAASARRAVPPPAATDGRAPPAPPPTAPEWTDGAEPFAAREPAARARPERPGRAGGRLVPAIVGGLLIAARGLVPALALPALQGRRGGRVRVVVPKGAGRGRDRRPAGRRGRGLELLLLRGPRHGERPARRPEAGQLHAAAGHEQRRGARRAGRGPARRTSSRSPSPRAARAGRSRASSATSSRATTWRPPGARRRWTRASTGPRARASLEGFLFPATYELKRGQPVRELVAPAAVGLPARVRRRSTCATRTAKNLTDYDVLIIASMVEREASIARGSGR